MIFPKMFTFVLFCLIFSPIHVYCRISNEKKCVDAGCSVPISYATTLLRYAADDERLISFPRNAKVTVFSKEAGDNPTFWEVEINGKRGFAPKGFLKETELLVRNDQVKTIVPTGRDDESNKNETQHHINPELQPNTLATPQLPTENSKGLFGMIGGVSADSVPPNSPDISPQSSQSYQVFQGTTIYDDNLTNEEPNKTPNIRVDDVPSAKHTNSLDKNTSEENKKDDDLHDDSGIASQEHISEGVIDKAENIEAQPIIDNMQSSGSVKEPNIISGVLHKITNFISSGNGDPEVEEEEEYEDEDEDYSVDEEDSEGDGSLDGENNPISADTTTKPEVSENSDISLNKENVSQELNIKNMEIPVSDIDTDDSKVILNNTEVEGNMDVSEHLPPIKKTPIVSDNIIDGKKDDSVGTNDTDSLLDGKLGQDKAGEETDPVEVTHKEEVEIVNANNELNRDQSNNKQSTTIDDGETATTSKPLDVFNEHVKAKQTETLSSPHFNKLDKAEVNDSAIGMPDNSAQNHSREAVTKSSADVNGMEISTTEEAAHSKETFTSVNDKINQSSFIDSVFDVPKSDPGEKQSSITEQLQVKSDTEKPDKNQESPILAEASESAPPSVTQILFGQPVLKNDINKDQASDKKDMLESSKKEEIESQTESTDDAVVEVKSADPTEYGPQQNTQLPMTFAGSEVVDNMKQGREGEQLTTESVKQVITESTQSSTDDFLEDITDYPESVTETTNEPLSDLQEDSYSTPPEYVSVDGDVPITEQQAQEDTGEGILSWFTSVLDLFGSISSSHVETVNSDDELMSKPETLDTTKTSYIKDETCAAGGVGEQACASLGEGRVVSQDITWQDTLYSSPMSTLELLDRIPLETTIWLVITAVVVLIFSLGHYYIEAHRRDGPLVAVINKLEREVLIMKKETCILEDKLHTAEQQVEAWNTNSSENDAFIVELKEELEETKLAKAELEEQLAALEREVETVTESGLEMHRLLSESLSSQDGSQVLLSTVETLRQKLEHQEEEITLLSQSLLHKNQEVDDLQDKLHQAKEVANSLEEKIIEISREKDEEALQLKDQHRQLIAQLEEVMETKALEETRVSTEMSTFRLNIEELQKTLAEKDSELEQLKEVVQQLRSTDTNEKMDALYDVVGVRAKLKTASIERDDYREKFHEEEGARKLLEGHMKKITQEVAELKNNFESAEKEKIEALTKLQVLSNYFKEKESQLQKELGLQESMWLQKQSDDHTIYEQMRSLREENEKYKMQNESLKKEIIEQESSFKIQLANLEQKSHEHWVASRQAERRLKEVQQEAGQLRNRLTMEKNANYSMDEGKQNLSESNGDPSSPPPSLIFPPTTSPPFMMYPMPPPGDFVPPPPLMSSPYPSDSRPPPLGRISSPPLDHRFSPPPPLPYPPYDYPPYGHHSPSPPPPMPSHGHHRNVHKPQPREMSREQKDHTLPNYSPEGEKSVRRNKR